MLGGSQWVSAKMAQSGGRSKAPSPAMRAINQLRNRAKVVSGTTLVFDHQARDCRGFSNVHAARDQRLETTSATR